MRHRRFDWHERIKAAEREYWSERIAIDRLSAEAAHDPTLLGRSTLDERSLKLFDPPIDLLVISRKWITMMMCRQIKVQDLDLAQVASHHLHHRGDVNDGGHIGPDDQGPPPRGFKMAACHA